ncbi:Cuticle protein 6 [Frankliniella fusca]|uniref:Cuticle protein 6 n=1 Tax=Frankliniella fusca TaxID=407009 RepID=A0AAE1LMM3_9NEOP|nr:Cuticle protein 6 [Frankliniella fusca]
MYQSTLKASLCAVARARFGGTLGGYNLAQTSQYHIQTDEGPERYFRYQTDSGQYRKEKRLEGTYGWVDAAGYLRLRDYVADNQGYRIVRTKKLWVGDEPIGRAVASAKYAPSQGGVGVSNAIIPNPTPSPYDVVYQPSVASVAPPETVYVTPPSPYGVRVSTTPSYLPPAPATSYLPPVSSTPRPYYPSSTPAVSVVSSTPSALLPLVHARRLGGVVHAPALLPVVHARPSPWCRPRRARTTRRPRRRRPSRSSSCRRRRRPGYASSSASPSVPDATPSPIRGDDATAYSSPHAPLRSSSSGSRPNPFHRGVTGYSANLYDHAAPPRRGYISELPGTYDANSNSVIPEYDGIAVTHNGFRYYLPRQYQEEENLPGDRRAGSFGYVDPFGIRRVIYYNSSPGSGFQVRKNNRYVGFNSTPYDPRF